MIQSNTKDDPMFSYQIQMSDCDIRTNTVHEI